MCNNINYQILSVEEKEICSFEEVKSYLRVTHKNDDRLIANLINSAVASAEQFLGISFFAKKICCTIGNAPNYLKMKYIPIVKIEKVFLVSSGDKKDITEDFGHIDFNHDQIGFAQEYLHKKLEINYEAGLGGHIPRTILHGILMHISMMYDFGENSVNISSEIKDIYLPYRVLKV
jgi:uncharacterized phiE125 gp8 family phage protein